MKLFRKKKESGNTAGAHGCTSHVLSSLTKDAKGEPSKGDAKKEDSQRRFVNRLYRLSHAHTTANNSLSHSLPEVLKSDSSAPAGSSPTACCSVTPDTTPQSSPVRVKATAARLANTANKNEQAGVLETIDAVFTQLAACTSDFFGEGVAAECVNLLDMGENDKGRTIVTKYPPVPATITFESALLTTPLRPLTPKRRLWSVVVDRSSIDGADELGGIVEHADRVTMKNNSVAYKPIKSSRSSLIDNIWVVSSFAEEDEPPAPQPVVHDELSITSTIPTRISHRL
jgi:hypothetical protein